jgi:hypothetical protein
LGPVNWHFINPELTVHVHREALGEWVCLEAQTATSPGGVGLTTSVLSDLDSEGWVPRVCSSPSAEPRGDAVIGLEVIAQIEGRDMFIDHCRDILGATWVVTALLGRSRSSSQDRGPTMRRAR